MTTKRQIRSATALPEGTWMQSSAFANPQRAAEAWLAASQTLLQGMGDVSKRNLMLQSALMTQAMNGVSDLLQLAQPDAKPEEFAASVEQATEATLQSIKEVITATCKCSTDALTAYRDRMAGIGPVTTAYRHHDDLRAAAE